MVVDPDGSNTRLARMVDLYDIHFAMLSTIVRMLGIQEVTKSGHVKSNSPNGLTHRIPTCGTDELAARSC